MEVRFEQRGQGRLMAYVPDRGSVSKSNPERNYRVKHVGDIEKRGTRWLWYLKGDEAIDFASSLDDAMRALSRAYKATKGGKR